MEKIQSMSTWFDILKWNSSPLFGPCHDLPYAKLVKQYFSSVQIVRLERDILQSFADGNTSSVRLHGEPGCGKTTFSYNLMKRYEYSEDQNAKYIFYIFHANRADDIDEFRELTRGEIKNAWRKYFLTCGQIDTFNLINSQQISRKERLNKFSTYYKANRKLFNKKLIFIIDDVDLLEDDMPFNIVSSVKKDFELASIIRWISIRPCTFSNYNAKTKKLLTEFFPTVYKMPNTSLSEIISVRINTIASSTEYINPFSEHLCNNILQMLFDGNKRDALSSMKSILENSLPKKIPINSNEGFIQTYIENNAINCFLNNDSLPNIHEESYRSLRSYPITHDIIQLLKHTNDKHILMGCLNEIATKRSRNNKSLIDASKKYQIRESDMNFSIQVLIDANIISKESGEHYRLTESGKILNLYAGRDHYHKVCKDQIRDIDVDSNYWDFMDTHVNYQQVAELNYQWKDSNR